MLKHIVRLRQGKLAYLKTATSFDVADVQSDLKERGDCLPVEA
jgi:hypothetical protein